MKGSKFRQTPNIYRPCSFKVLKFRDLLYDVFIYNLNICECMWYLLHRLITEGKIKKKYVSEVLIKSFVFLKYYNNNYRPIYHLESILFYIIVKLYHYELPESYSDNGIR